MSLHVKRDRLSLAFDHHKHVPKLGVVLVVNFVYNRAVFCAVRCLSYPNGRPDGRPHREAADDGTELKHLFATQSEVLQN